MTATTPRRRVSKRTLEIENEEFRLVNEELEDKLSRSQARGATLRAREAELMRENQVLTSDKLAITKKLAEVTREKNEIKETLERLLTDISEGKILREEG